MMTPGRYAKLTKDWLLRGWTDMPRAVVNWTNGDQRQLSKRGLYVAQACDGATDFDSVAFLPVHRAFLDKLIEEGIAERCECGDSIDACQQYREAENPRLNGLQWAITGLCNLHCRHCYMEAPSGRYGEPSFEESLDLIEQFEQANVHQVSLTGGEPFVRKDLLDIMEALAQKRICVSQIYTNGLLITEDLLAGVRKIGFSPVFQISFDGCGAHDYMRGAKAIEGGVIEAIRKVRAADFQVIVATSVDRTTRDCLPHTYELLKGLGIQFWRLSPPQERGNWRGAMTGLSLEEEAEAYEPLLRRWVEDGRPISLQLGGFFRGAGRDVSVPDQDPRAQHTPDSYDCGACRETPCLLPDGTLLPCPGYTDTAVQDRMPNVLRDGLSKALNQPFLRTMLDMKKGDLLAENEECAVCEWFAECGMGCRAIALAETGNLMARDPVACDLWKRGYNRRFAECTGAAT
ncbi:MAG: radical SAM protein [Planctomycetota bacterium]